MESCGTLVGKPIENAFVESFNGKLRGEVLSEHWFERVAEAADQAELWCVDYNENRPHKGTGRRTPAEARAAYERAEAFNPNPM